MVKDIVKYPTPPSVEFGTDVRLFNEELFSVIGDLKDTIIENSLDGLAAYQIGCYFNVIVVKEENGEFLELINPRILTTNGKITVTESTGYFPGLTAEVQRYKTISLVYQDRDSNQHSLKADGEFSTLLQRKIDYTFGSTFLPKLSKEEKKIFETKLEYGSNLAVPESCPTTFKRDKVLKVATILTYAIALLLLVSLFVSDEDTLLNIWNYQTYLSYVTIVFITVYFFYAQYEGKQYKHCTSCQIGNIIGTTVVLLVKLVVLFVANYFLVGVF